MLREDPGEVALIGEAAVNRDVRQGRTRPSELLLCALDPKAQPPLMRSHSE
jgi:hypothetical protein